MHLPALDILIVNWNSGALLAECLKSITRADRPGFHLRRVVVVDNASTDASATADSATGLPLTILLNERNRGFGAACNQAAQGSAADYLLFLNPDAVLCGNSLTVPIAFMERPQNERVGICGIQLLDGHGNVSRSCARFPTPLAFLYQLIGLDRIAPHRFRSHQMREWDHRQTREVDHVIGAFYLMRRNLFAMLGGFDERFFVYLEDLDLSRRAHLAGWKTCYLTEARATHVGGGTTEQIRARRLAYALRSRIQYGFKHFGFAAATALLLGTLLVEPVSRVAWAGMRLNFRDLGQSLQGFLMLWKSTPQLLVQIRHDGR